MTFSASRTYTINTVITLTDTSASNITFVSGTPGTQYNFVLAQGATQDIDFVACTDANSSTGLTIFPYKGTLSNTTNWINLTNPSTISY